MSVGPIASNAEDSTYTDVFLIYLVEAFLNIKELECQAESCRNAKSAINSERREYITSLITRLYISFILTLVAVVIIVVYKKRVPYILVAIVCSTRTRLFPQSPA
jgi:hypothetical protein